MYYPCIECFNRYGRRCTVECIDSCDYMSTVKRKDDRIQALEELVEIKDAKLIAERVKNDNLLNKLAKLERDLEYAYQTVCKLRGDE